MAAGGGGVLMSNTVSRRARVVLVVMSRLIVKCVHSLRNAHIHVPMGPLSYPLCLSCRRRQWHSFITRSLCLLPCAVRDACGVCASYTVMPSVARSALWRSFFNINIQRPTFRLPQCVCTLVQTATSHCYSNVSQSPAVTNPVRHPWFSKMLHAHRWRIDRDFRVQHRLSNVV